MGLLFDDIDINNIGIESDDKDLGKFHGELISEVTTKLGLSNGWFCPSIYCKAFLKREFKMISISKEYQKP